MKQPETQSGGLSGCTVLTMIFVVLKLCGLIDWSWWWVLSPIWGAVALVVAVIAAATLVRLFLGLMD